MTQQMLITGIRKVKGSTENGITYDFTRVFSTARMDPTKDDRAGYAGIELKALPVFYEKFMGYDFKPEGSPFEVDIETIAIGKGDSVQMITKMLPVLKSAAAVPPKAAAVA